MFYQCNIITPILKKEIIISTIYIYSEIHKRKGDTPLGGVYINNFKKHLGKQGVFF